MISMSASCSRSALCCCSLCCFVCGSATASTSKSFRWSGGWQGSIACKAPANKLRGSARETCSQPRLSNPHPLIRPIRVLRLFVSVFFMVFYIASLGVFLVALDCEWAAGPPYYVHAFPTQSCLSMPHLINLAFSAILTVLFILVTLGMTGARHPTPCHRLLVRDSHAVHTLSPLALN